MTFSPCCKDPAEKWILWGIPAIILVSGPLHFTFEWLSKATAVGLFTPVNESVWEHLKLTFIPLLIWWTAGYFIFHKKNNISAARWFVPAAAASLVIPMVILSLFYILKGAFSLETLFLDILSLILAVIMGQVLALQIYRHAEPRRCTLVIALAVLALWMAAFITFTLVPPHLPLFIDPSSGMYGIK